ncbi:MAG: ribosomal L7Ae/L30e/S12e/Gadd45 family protein [Clostridia bacterium]|nr:ribosomal L7Ae/L30e/S12e/Gadd45 family protein [Clostridia bacterium]
MTKAMGLLGLAKRAGRVVSGESACKEAIRFGKSYLILLAGDVSVNTSKSITDSCKFYDVPYVVTGTKESLGAAIGNEFNAVVSVNDEGFANGILKHINANIKEGE